MIRVPSSVFRVACIVTLLVPLLGPWRTENRLEPSRRPIFSLCETSLPRRLGACPYGHIRNDSPEDTDSARPPVGKPRVRLWFYIDRAGIHG